MSDQKIGQIVSAKAIKISQESYKLIGATLADSDCDLIQINPNIDIYNSREKEILLFDDGIQVKGQKAQRQKESKQESNSEKLLGEKTPALTTDIVILQKATTGFEYIAAPINALGENLRAFSQCRQG